MRKSALYEDKEEHASRKLRLMSGVSVLSDATGLCVPGRYEMIATTTHEGIAKILKRYADPNRGKAPGRYHSTVEEQN